MIQVGLVGIGPLWERYRPALSRLRRPIHVEAVYDPVFARAESAAKVLDADPVHGIRALAARGNVEAVLVMDPAWMQASVLPLLARQEKPVFFAASLLDGANCHRQLTTLQADPDCLIMPAMWRRFVPTAIRIQELIATELGRPQHITVDLVGAAHHSAPQKSITLESVVGWLDFCRNLFRAFPVSASLCDNADKPSESASPLSPLELRIDYPQTGGLADRQSLALSPPPDDRYQRTARLLFQQPVEEQRQITASPIAAADFMRHLLDANAHLSPTVSSVSAVSSQPEFPEIAIRCERGTARLNSETQLQWQTDSPEPVQETLTSERTKEEIMLDIFCRRVVGGLIPVADLNDILKPIQLLRDNLEM